jgi:PhnB protein
MQLSPYLSFNGQCEEAFKFYEKCLGGKITGMSTHERAEVIDKTPPEWRHKVLFASLKVGNEMLLGSDLPPHRYVAPRGSYVSLVLKDAAEAERIFNALAENGRVEMAIQETFWAARFGTVVDRFGISWMINCLRPE